MHATFSLIWILLFFVCLWYGFRKERVKFVLVLWFFFTSGFQLVPVQAFETIFGVTKAADFGIAALTLVVVTRRRHIWRQWGQDKFSILLGLFFVFLVIAALYSIFIYHVSIGDVIRSVRFFLILLLYFEFKAFSVTEWKTLVKHLRILTSVQCVIFLMQYPAGTALLNTGLYESEVKDVWLGPILFPRYYAFPLLAPFFLFETMYRFEMRGRDLLHLALFAAPVILPMHRSWIFSLGVAMVLLVARTRVRIKMQLVVLLLLLVSVLAFLQERLQTGITDFVEAVSGGYDMANRTEDNLSLRLAHLYERGMYGLSSAERFIFGAGMITEESPQAEQLGFIVGYRGETGAVLQVNMGDIAWSSLILRFGFVGAILFLVLYIRSIEIVWTARNWEYSTVASCYLLLFLFTTITSSLTIEPHTYAFLSATVAIAASYHPTLGIEGKMG